jgi:hypothetical protein
MSKKSIYELFRNEHTIKFVCRYYLCTDLEMFNKPASNALVMNMIRKAVENVTFISISIVPAEENTDEPG